METLVKKEKVKRKGRVWEVDFLRGLCILMMVFDHLMFDLMFLPDWTSNFYEVNNAFFNKAAEAALRYWNWEVRIAVRITVVFTFLFLSGISCAFSRGNGKRLLKLCIAAAVLSLGTAAADALFDLESFILFGILYIMAASLLIYILLKKIWDNKYLYLAVGLVFLIIGIIIKFNELEWEEGFSPKIAINTMVGLSNYGADSYGIVPYTGVFLIGAFFGRILYADKKTLIPLLSGGWSKPVSFIGRNTVWVYILHQPIILIIVMGIAMMVGYKIF